ncbi:MAG: hypothetical protein PHH77_10900 [Victivallaceae bacterium]|nr:hypothetical protein [Victivallaceae bacterium]
MNELVKQENIQLPVASINDLAEIGTAIAKSGMFGINSDSAGMVLAMTCYQEKITPLDFIRTYHIIKGRPTMRADAMLATFSQFGGKYKIVEYSPEKAAAAFEIDGRTLENSFTWEEAKQESYVYREDGKTLKDNWSTPRRRKEMLWARLVSESIRTIAPQVCKGVYTPEETASFTEVATPREEKAIDPAAANAALKKTGKAKPKPEPQGETVDVKATEIKEDENTDEHGQSQTDTDAGKQAAAKTPGERLFDEADRLKREAEKVDYSTCPISTIPAFAGLPWARFEKTEALISCLNAKDKFPEMTAGHVEALKAEIRKRQQEAGK